MSDTMLLTGNRLMEVRQAFLRLDEKRLPSVDAETLTASLYDLLLPAIRQYDAVVKKLQAEGKEVNEMPDGDAKTAAIKAVNDKVEALGEQIFEVKAPKTKLSFGHLPKSHKGTDGEMNPVGNGAIRRMLGAEFFDGPKPESDTKGDTVAE